MNLGEPEDVAGECNARCYIGDDFGDNSATMRCRREPGHGGRHRERFERDGGEVVVEWDLDESQYWFCQDCRRPYEPLGELPELGTRCDCGSEMFGLGLRRDMR